MIRRLITRFSSRWLSRQPDPRAHIRAKARQMYLDRGLDVPEVLLR